MDDSLSRYLRDISRYPLLSAAEEVELARAVRAADDDPSPAVQRAAHRAGQQLISANLRLVVRICRKWRSASRCNSTSIDFLDLVQEGNLGLHHAVRKFDPSKGYRFTTYAWAWVESYIRRAIAQKSRLVRVPTQVHERLGKLSRLVSELQRTGQPLCIATIAEQLGITPADARVLLQHQHTPISIDASVREDSEESWLDLVLADAGAEREQAAAEAWAMVERVLVDAELTPDEYDALIAVLWDGEPRRQHRSFGRALEKARAAAQPHPHQLRLHFEPTSHLAYYDGTGPELPGAG